MLILHLIYHISLTVMFLIEFFLFLILVFELNLIFLLLLLLFLNTDFLLKIILNFNSILLTFYYLFDAKQAVFPAAFLYRAFSLWRNFSVSRFAKNLFCYPRVLLFSIPHFSHLSIFFNPHTCLFYLEKVKLSRRRGVIDLCF